MILLYTMLYVILFILVVYFLFRIIKSVLKVVFIVIFIILFSIGAFGFLIYSDVKGISENMGDEPKLIAITEGKKIIVAAEIAGMPAEGAESGSGQDKYKILDADTTEKLSDFYSGDELKKVQGDYYKVFFISSESIEDALSDLIDVPEDTYIDEMLEEQTAGITSVVQKPKMPETVTRSELMSMILAGNPKDTFIDITLKGMPASEAEFYRLEMSKQLPGISNDDIRVIAIALASNAIVKEKNLDVLFSAFQKGDILIYPETIIFKIAKGIPYSMMEKYVPARSSSEANSSLQKDSFL